MADTPDILWLKLDETSGTTATATVGSNGTYQRNATNTFTTDSPGTALSGSQDFSSAANDFVTMSVSSSSGSPLTICAWMKFDILGGTRALFGAGGNTPRFIIGTTGTVAQVSGTSGTSSYTISLTTATWYHVALTRDSSNNVRVFINGTESSTGAQTIAQAINPIYVGRSSGNYHDGPICDFRVYSTAKNAAALAAIMAEKDSALPAVKRRRLSLLGVG